MDLVKIGSYIAEKRKKLGMTQKQLAEKLGKSDKSVSKWERGICLPDVSVYLELCEILGISLNEFLAGEDIEVTNVEKKSEDTLIQILLYFLLLWEYLLLLLESWYVINCGNHKII